MKNEIIQLFTDNFGTHSHTTDSGVEFWFARDIQHLLGYSDWRNFNQVIIKAKIFFGTSNNKPSDHFVEANKMVVLGSNSQRKYKLFSGIIHTHTKNDRNFSFIRSKRLAQLKSVNKLGDFKFDNPHPLKGDRKTEFTITIMLVLDLLLKLWSQKNH